MIFFLMYQTDIGKWGMLGWGLRDEAKVQAPLERYRERIPDRHYEIVSVSEPLLDFLERAYGFKAYTEIHSQANAEAHARGEW